MSLRKPAKAISFVLLFCLLAWYSRRYMGEVQEEILVAAWSRAFRRLNGDCIYWMALRLAAWLFIYLRLLRLESGFSVYLFLRRRSFARVFLRTYTGCLGTALCYYCLGTLIMAVCHWAAVPGTDLGLLLWQERLPEILAGECLGSLSLCLAAYLVFSLCGRAEAGFLAVLTGRLLWGFGVGETGVGLPVQAVLGCVLAGAAFFAAARNFYFKMGAV